MTINFNKSTIVNTTPNSFNDFLLFEGFIAYIKRQGFVVGVDTHLRLQNLLNQINGDYGKSELKHLLAPIFVTNPKQQQLFYQAFDNYFDQFDTIPLTAQTSASTSTLESSSSQSLKNYLPKKRNYWLLGLMVFGIGVLLIWMLQKEELNQLRQEYTERIKQTIGLEQQQNPDSTSISLPPIAETPERTPFSETRFNNSGKIPLTLKPDIEENIEYLIAKWYERMGWWLQLAKWAILLGIFTAFVFYQLYRRNKKQALLQRERNQAPPDYWNPLQVADTPKKLYQSSTFYQTAKEMRVRVKGDAQVLNVERSIAATLESGGYPSFEYDDTSRPVEYLVLIEEQTPKDHQARFFERLTKELAQQDVYIERYFYQNDPRHCWKIEYQIETNLHELAMRFPTHRLLVMGNGGAFLDALTEEVLMWTQQFSAWKTRFLVTPKPTNDWGFAEIQLSHIFHILPANIAALEKMDDLLLHPEQYPLKYWLSDTSTELPSMSSDVLEVQRLKQSMGAESYQLVCACAVYPELHWDFTLHLAKKMTAAKSVSAGSELNGKPAIGEKNSLLLPSNLLQLARLSWFREGYIPDTERQTLLADLQPENEAMTREAIVQLLKENPPPTNSYAYDEYAMNLAVNEWELAEGQDKKEHQKALAELMERDKLLQFVRIKYESTVQKIKNAFAMPELLRENLFKSGLPILGFKNYALTAIVLFLLAFIGWFIEVPEGEHLTEFEGEYFYLANKRDTARFYHYQAQINPDPVQKQALLDTALAIDTTYAKARYNLALTYYDAQEGDGSEADSLLENRAMASFLKASKIYDIDYESDLENMRLNARHIRFAPSDTCFATISDGNVVRLWDLDGYAYTDYVGHTDEVTSVNFSENRPWVITSSMDGTVRIWDIDGTELYVYSQPYHLYTYACFVPDSANRILVTYVGEERNLETSTVAELEITENGDGTYTFGEKKDISYISIGVKNPDFSEDAQEVLYASKNQIVQKKLASGEHVQVFEHTEDAIAGFFVLDDLLQVTVSMDGELTVHDANGQMHTTKLAIRPYAAGISKSGKYVFIADENTGETEIWTLKLSVNGAASWNLAKAALKGNIPIVEQISSNSSAAAFNSSASDVEYDFTKLNTTFGGFGTGKHPVAYSNTGKYTLIAHGNTLFLTEADFRSIAYSLYNLGVIQYNKQDYAKAVSFFSQAHSHSPRDTAVLYARAVSHLYMDSLRNGLKDIAAVLDLDENYFDTNQAILPLLQDFYLRTTGELQQEVLRTLEALGIDIAELEQIAERQRLKQLLGEEWKGVYLIDSKFSNDIKWRNFAKLNIEADGTVYFNGAVIQDFNYTPEPNGNSATLQWSAENGNESIGVLQFRRRTYGNYKQEEWAFNKSRTNIFNFFELQDQLIDQQFASLKGNMIEGNMTLQEETQRAVRGWTFDATPPIFASYYIADTPAPNFNEGDYAYVSEPNQYGLMRVQGENGLWGLINLRGQELLPTFYEGIGIFSDGLAGIQKNEKLGFINPEGEVVIKPQFDEVTIFKNGIATVKVDGRTFEIDKKGNRVNELAQTEESLHSDEKASENEDILQAEIGQYEQMKVKKEDTRQQLLAPAGMVYVEGGPFVVGNDGGEADERPAHRTFVNDFYMDKYEVTNAQFAQFLKEYGSNSVKSGTYAGRPLFEETRERLFSRTDGKIAQRVLKGYENLPVRNVTWYGANEYARFYGKRLPTEAEWEFAAAGGLSNSEYRYSGSNDANQVAWYENNSNGTTNTVGKKRANELGIYDMSGNVAEWCQDWYAPNAYSNTTANVTTQKVIRGGAFSSSLGQLEVTDRESAEPLDRSGFVGFRCVKDFGQKQEVGN